MVESHSILPRSRTSDDAVKIYVPTYPLYVKSFDISRCANGRQEKKSKDQIRNFASATTHSGLFEYAQETALLHQNVKMREEKTHEKSNQNNSFRMYN